MPLSEYHRKLYGWLSYAFASEVFVIVSLTLFLPICLEQFARDNGFLLPEKTLPCSPTVETNSSEPNNLGRCVVKIGWIWVDTASFSLYTFSISVLTQAITVISMGGIADHPNHRKPLLFGFALLGSTAAICFILLSSTSPVWLLSAFLAIFANVGFGAAMVASNAYLPSLARDAPEVVAAFRHQHSDSEEYQALLSASNRGTEDNSAYQTVLSSTTSRISSLGIALGYAAGIVLLILTLIPVTKLHGSTWSLRLAIGLSGAWWTFFSIIAAFLLPGGGARQEEPKAWNTAQEIIGAWKRLGGMLRWTEIKKLKNTFRYLAAWFLLSDGFTTITSTAILFAKTTLHMPAQSLILVGVLTPLSGIIGSLLVPIFQRWRNNVIAKRTGQTVDGMWTNKAVLVALVLAVSVVPAYGCLGFLPFFGQGGKARFGGLTTEGEMFGLAFYFGSVYGAFQAYARAFYAELLPPGEEARWYGLFSITDKSSSFLGPLLVGLVADVTGNIRYAFFFLVAMIWLAVPVLLGVNVEKGRKDAGVYRWGGESGNVNEEVPSSSPSLSPAPPHYDD